MIKYLIIRQHEGFVVQQNLHIGTFPDEKELIVQCLLCMIRSNLSECSDVLHVMTFIDQR